MTCEGQAAELNVEELLTTVRALEVESAAQRQRIAHIEQERDELAHQVEWFKRQLFGEKSEKRLPVAPSEQLHLGEMLNDELPPPPKETVKQYQRRRRPKEPLAGSPEDSGLRFDESVPVQEISVPNPAIEGRSEDEYEVLSEDVTYRLAQRPGSYVVLKYIRKTVKLKETRALVTPPAPRGVLGKSFADVSLLAGLLIDKFMYHLPLYRQHQRLQDCGVKLSRATLTNLTQGTIALLEPIYFAVLSSILQSKVLLMDETPIKAGHKSPGKMKTGYFWPTYGDKDEIAFPFATSRAEKVVREVLGSFCGVLLTDGYKVYEKYCEKVPGIVHAQCWAHTRRKFVDACRAEPVLAEMALEKIGELYRIEAQLREAMLAGEEKRRYRGERATPIVDDFFKWLNQTFSRQVLLASNRFAKAASYALHREQALRVFLDHPEVEIDTNKDERALRPIPMGRKNWLFCSTELGGRYVGIAQTLIQSCRLQEIDPWPYLIDVLQRIDTHPAFDVHLLTPRLWKKHFAENPMRSDLRQ
jgi:transposase